MWKFLTLTLLFFEIEASTLTCSVRKSDSTCICRRIFNDKLNTIENEADCSRINLQDLPDSDQMIQDLTHLDLSHNEISDLDESTNKFSSATVESLLLSYNDINTISVNFFQDLPKLRRLDLSHNNLTVLSNEFGSLGNLEHLDLSFNYIKTVKEKILLPLGQLNYFDLSYNDKAIGDWLTTTPDSLLALLGLNPNVETLQLDNLGLQKLPYSFFMNYTSLLHLSIADNHFEDVPLVPRGVTYLDLSGSDISALEPKSLNFYSVKTLKLERLKKLETIRPYTFYNLLYLEELSIRNCHNLKEFNEMLFGTLSRNMSRPVKLKRLSLAGNGLEKLNSTYKYLFRTMDMVDLTDNPWRCDCHLLWLLEFENLYKSEKIKCSSPARVSSKSLIDIVDKDLPSCYPQKYGKKSHRVLISLLAVAVILLSVLVAYLIYYTPNWYTSRRLGPQSPYNAARTEEE